MKILTVSDEECPALWDYYVPGRLSEYDLIIGMDKSNMQDMLQIMGGDPQGKLSLMLDWCGEHRDVADPWYTHDFDATWRDVLRGCQALLDHLAKQNGWTLK